MLSSFAFWHTATLTALHTKSVSVKQQVAQMVIITTRHYDATKSTEGVEEAISVAEM